MSARNEKIEVTEHAIDKFMSVTGCNDRDKSRKRLVRFYLTAHEEKIDPSYLVDRLIANGLVEAEYFEKGCHRLVVADGIIVTFEEKFKQKA